MIAEGTTVAAVDRNIDAALETEMLKALTVGEGRTFEQDPGLAIRLLADIAVRHCPRL